MSNLLTSMSLRVTLLIMLLVPLFANAPAALAQAETGVSGSSYTSPTFGYSLEWDDEVWEVNDEIAEDGYDALVLESEDALLYIEGVYFYQGDPDECLDGELETLADQVDVEELELWEDENGNTVETTEDGAASGIWEFPETGNPDEVVSVLQMECSTLIPDSAVLIVSAFVRPDDVEGHLELVADVTGTLEVSDDAGDAFDEGDFEQSLREVALDVDGFWIDVFNANDQSYVKPAYITFLDLIETDCGDASAGESGPFYCPADATIYFDLEEMINFELPYGFIIIQMVVAHEIAHHVQSLRDLSGCQDEICGRIGSSLAIELQADCLAGAWMRDAADRDVVQQRDLKHLEVAIKNYLADPPGTRQNDPEAHGDGNTRFTMFMTGYIRGITACGFE